jgi:hypothetical protein
MRTMQPVALERPARTVGPLPGGGPKRSRSGMAVAIAVVVAMIVSVAAVFAVRERNDTIAAVTTQRNQATALNASQAAQLARVRARLAAATRAAGVDKAKLQAQLNAMLGPPLSDGRYLGNLVAVGANQDPPRLVIDVEQWFTGDAATEAARADGQLPPGETTVPDGFYIRNQNPRWRTIEIDPATTVALTVWPNGQVGAPQVMTLDRFGTLFNVIGGGASADALHYDPYWITVQNGNVVAIHQQYLP